MLKCVLVVLLILAGSNSWAQDVKTVIEAYLAKVGGKDSIEAIRTSSKSYRYYNLYPKPDTSVATVLQRLPSEQVTRSTSGSGKLTAEHFVNSKGSTLALYVPFPSVLLDHFVVELSLNPALDVLQHFKKNKLKVLRQDTLNGEPCTVVGTSYHEVAAHNKSYYFSISSGLLIAEQIDDSPSMTLYLSYRKAGFFLFPWVWENYLGTTHLSRTEYDRVGFNIPVNAGDFQFNGLDRVPPLRKAYSRFNKIEWVDNAWANLPFRDLIGKFNGKKILIDVWATWCGPCKYEFTKYDDSFYAFLEKEQITMLFMSIDKSDKEQQWKKDVGWYYLNGYQLMAGKALYASLKKEINDGNELMIPRYILINEKGEILSPNLGKPSAFGFREKVEELLK